MDAHTRAGRGIHARPSARDGSRMHVGDDGSGAERPARIVHPRPWHRSRKNPCNRRARRAGGILSGRHARVRQSNYARTYRRNACCRRRTRASLRRGATMKRVVSVSLGSSSRDHRAEIDLLGERFDISRIGMNGSLDRALAKIAALDGTVDAIGLGGIDVYLYAGKDRYALRDGLRLLAAAKETPVVDGSGLKNTLEREAVGFLQTECGIALRDKRVLMVSALD